jgi:hypothetical protein
MRHLSVSVLLHFSNVHMYTVLLRAFLRLNSRRDYNNNILIDVGDGEKNNNKAKYYYIDYVTERRAPPVHCICKCVCTTSALA